MNEVNYEEIDPGIRGTVKLLRTLGYDTCDSGDGKTKFSDPENVMECAIPFPNVFMIVPEENCFVVGRKLAEEVATHFNPPPDREEGVPGWSIEMSWDNWTGVVLLGLLGIDDTMLKETANG